MIERKRPAQAVLVGFQGRALACHSWQSGASSMSELCAYEAENNVRTLEQTLRSAGELEAELMQIGSSDEQVSTLEVREMQRLSRMRLECLGFLPIGGSNG